MTEATTITESTESARPPHDPDTEALVAEMLATTRQTERGRPPSFPAVTSQDACPVFQIGSQLTRLIGEHDRLQDLEDAEGDVAVRNGIQHRQDNVQEQISVLRRAAGYHRATSFEGAILHLAIAYDALVATTECEAGAAGNLEFRAAAKRHLYSAVSVLRAAAGLHDAGRTIEYFMPDSLDVLGSAWSAPEANEAASAVGLPSGEACAMEQPRATKPDRTVPRHEPAQQSVSGERVAEVLNSADAPAEAEGATKRLDFSREFMEFADIIRDIRNFGRCVRFASDSAWNQTDQENLDMHKWAIETLEEMGRQADDKLDKLETFISKQRIYFQKNTKTEA